MARPVSVQPLTKLCINSRTVSSLLAHSRLDALVKNAGLGPMVGSQIKGSLRTLCETNVIGPFLKMEPLKPLLLKI